LKQNKQIIFVCFIFLKKTSLTKSDQIWSNLIKFDQIWSNLSFDQIWSDLIRFDQNCNPYYFWKKHNCGTNVFECSHFCAKLFFGFEQIHICFLIIYIYKRFRLHTQYKTNMNLLKTYFLGQKMQLIHYQCPTKK
jgi:hypothetical protein